MPQLLIQYVNGESETRTLSKKEPLSIGKHPSNDIIIDADGVATLHCRIAWNKEYFEVVAAGPDGLDVDGTQVRHAVLGPGNVLRVGDADITVEDDGSPKKKKQQKQPEVDEQAKQGGPKQYSDPEVGLGPISEDEVPSFMQRPREVREKQNRIRQEAEKKQQQTASKKETKQKAKETKTESRKRKSSKEKEPPREVTDDSLEIISDPEFIDESEEPVVRQPLTRIKVGGYQSDDESKEDDDKGENGQRGELEDEKEQQPKWKTRDRRYSRRPGEQELLKSPFVLILGGVTLVLLLAAGTYSFLILRSLADNQFKAAEIQREQKNFGPAAKLYQEFLTQYPRHALTNKARIGLSATRVEAEISGSANRWKEGLEALGTFIEDQRAREDFESLSPQFASYAGTIAVGAAKDAGRTKNWSLIDISKKAEGLFERYSQDGVAKTGRIKEINTARRASEESIQEFEFQTKKTAQIDAAIKAADTRSGFQRWNDLVLQYPKLKTSKGMVKRLQQLLDLEKSQFALETIDQAAQSSSNPDEGENESPGEKTITIATRYRSRTDTKPNGEVVFALSNGLLVAFESMTGKSIWQKNIGRGTPFFPVLVTTSVEGALLYSSAEKSLMLLNRKNGNLVWQQPLRDEPLAAPLVHQGQIYISASSGLYQIDLSSGHLRSRLNFPQPPSTTPTTLESGEHLVVPAEQDVIYTLKLRPLECVAVTFTAHSRKSIVHPLLRAGKNLIASVNDRVNRTQLRVYEPNGNQGDWILQSTKSVQGAALDRPLLRGNRLFLPTRPERVSVFVVSDEQGTDALTQLTTSQIENPIDVPVYLAAGPDDQIWVNSSSVRNYQLTAETLAPNPKVVAAGYPSQQLQFRGTHLFVGRKLPYSTGTILTQMERTQLAGLWRANIGAKIISLNANPNNKRLLAVNDLGEIFTFSSAQLSSGEFLDSSTFQLEIPEGMPTSLQASRISNGNLIVTLSGRMSQLWTLNAAGQVTNTIRMKGHLALPPVEFDNRLLVAMRGSLQMLKGDAIDSSVQPFQRPLGQEESPDWVWIDTLTESKFAALDEAGELSVFELRKGNAPHIAQVVSARLNTPASVAHIGAGKLASISNTKTLNVYDDNLEIVSTLQLPALPQGRLWVNDGRLVLTTSDGDVHGVAISDPDKIAWTIKNVGSDLSGPPLVHNGTLIIAFTNGTVVSMDEATGEVRSRRETQHAFDSAPVVLDDTLVIATTSGQLVTIPLKDMNSKEGIAP